MEINFAAGTVAETDLDSGFSEIIKLAPYLSNHTLDTLVQKLDALQDVHKINRLAPFLSSETLVRISEKRLAQHSDSFKRPL